MLCFGVSQLLISNPASAAVGINRQINFQGKLVNLNGTNVTDGSYSVVFSIYTVSTAGTAIWTETQTVGVTTGIFQVDLGSVTALPGTVDFNSDNIYLGIKVGADAEMTPRVRFTAVPQAFNSEKLGGLDKAGFVQNGTSQQAATNFNISGTGVVGTSLTSPLIQNAGTLTLAATGANSLLLQTNGATRLTVDSAGGASFSGTLSVAGVITSTVATGTAPLTVASTTKVTNLNVDLLDGLDSTAFAAATGSANYIQNQSAGAQASANFNIDGSGAVGTVFNVGTTASHQVRINPNFGLSDFYQNEANPRWSIATDLIGSGLSAYTLSPAGNSIANGGVGLGVIASGTLGLYTSNGTAFTERLRIDPNGNVGVATAAPIYKLDVNGTVRSSSPSLSVGSNGVTAEGATNNLLYGAGTGNGISGASNLTASTTTFTSLGNGKYRITTNATGGATIRLYANLATLTNGATYASSLAFENNTGTVSMDWSDVALSGTNTSSAASSGRIYGFASRATYDATFRFLDINLGLSSTVDVYDVQTEAGSVSTSFAPGARALGDIVARGNVTLTDGSLVSGTNTVLTSTRVLQNVTADANILTTGTLASGRLTGTYSGLTGTGALATGSIATGFGTILTANTIQGSQLISSVATGTAPLTVASTTKVTNLNADLLDGLDSTAFAAASGSANYIQNQNAGAQAGANFNIAGSGTMAAATINGGGLALNFNGPGSNYINFGANGVAPPSTTTRSLGTKIILYPQVTATDVDYALGIDGSTFWNSVPANTAAYNFKWYGGTSQIGALSGVGNMTLAGTLTAQSTANSVFGNGTTGGIQLGDGTLTKTGGGLFQLNSGLNLISSDLQLGGVSVITATRTLQNVTADASILTAGTLASGRLTGAYTGITGVGTLTGLTSSGVITSTVATGTAPLSIASTTQVPNLNVSMLGGFTENQIAQNLRSNINISGGGTVTWNGSLNWTSRFIVISNGNGADFSTTGYFDIIMPAAGTIITGVGGNANVTTTAGGVPLTAWQALYYILPIGSGNTSLNANFRVANYTGSLTTPSNWVLVAINNGDNGTLKLSTGFTLRSGQTVTNGTIDNPTFNGAINTAVGYQIGGTAGAAQYLRGNGTNFVSSAIQAADLPSGSGNYIQNGSVQQAGNFNISGTGTLVTLNVNGVINGQSVTLAGDVLNVGNDSKIVDINVANTSAIYGIQDTTVGGLKLGSGGPTLYGAGANLGINNTNPSARLHVTGVGLFNAAGGTTPVTNSALEVDVSSQSAVTIGESAAGNANPAITLYRTSGGLRTGTASRIFNPNSNGTLEIQSGTANTAYGAETYTTNLTVTAAGAANARTGFQVNGAAGAGQFLRGDGTNFVSSALQAADLPSGSANYIQNGTGLQTANFNVSGTGAVLGDFTNGNQVTRSLTRTLPTVVNTEVDLGSFSLTNGGGNLEIDVTVPSAGYSQTKQYTVPIGYDGTANTWRIVVPTNDSGAFGGNDFALDINVSLNVASLRLRKTAGTTAGTAYVTITQQGIATDSFAASSASAAVAAPTLFYSPTVISQSGGTATVQGNLTVTSGSSLTLTGVTTNGVLFGNNTGAIQATAAGITGQCLIGNTGAAPSFGVCGAGVTTVASFSASSQPNGASIASNTITFGPADATNPGMVSTGTQSFAGAKTFLGATSISNTADSAAAFRVVRQATATNVLTVDTTNSQAILRGINSSATEGGNTFGGFATTAGWTIGGSGSTSTAAHANGGGTTAIAASPAISVSVDTVYKVTYTVSGRTTGSVFYGIGGIFGFVRSTNATFTEYYAASTTANLTFVPTNDFNGTVSAVSVQAVTMSSAVLQIQNSTGTPAVEIRASNISTNQFIGLKAGRNNTTGIENTALGTQALEANTTGNLNTANGAFSLQVNTTGSNNTAFGGYSLFRNTNGGDNTAIGAAALQDNTTGASNTALGSFALLRNTNGTGNNAVGASALQSNTTGFNNSADGSFALFTNTTGTNNTAQGRTTLYFNTTGSNNTATGSAALENNTNGFSNTATGRSSLRSNTTGVENTSNGSYALDANTVGQYNAAVGAYSLFNNTSGLSNTSVGAYSMLENTTGLGNTALGYQAGSTTVAANGNTVGSNNTYVGAYTGAGVTSATSLQNASAIGTRAVVSANNSLVLGSINGLNGASATVNVGIGIAAPTARLHVVGAVNTASFSTPASVVPVLILDTAATSSQNVTELRVAGTRRGSIRADLSGNVVYSGSGTGAVYLGFDEGTGGVNFGNGTSGIVASISGTGLGYFSNRVGIGTTATPNTLSVQASGDGTGSGAIRAMASDAATNGGYTVLSQRSSAGGAYGYLQSGDNANVRNIVLNPDGGNIGIGTTLPAAKLDVRGAALGSTAGNLTELSQQGATTGNNVYVRTLLNRNSAGADWTTASIGFQRVTDTTPQGSLWFNSSSSVCINTTSCFTNGLGVNGDIVASGAIVAGGTPDIAETILAAPDVEAADVVMADPLNTERVVKSDKAYSGAAVGVIADGTSTFTIAAYGKGTDTAGYKPLVLAGRVPVKVTNEGGFIRPGDPLTSSSTPGFAMKATKAGPIIGKALGSFDEVTGKVLVLVNSSYINPSDGDNLQAKSVSAETLFASRDITAGGNVNVGANLNVSGISTVTDLIVKGSVTIAKNLTVEGLTSVQDLSVAGHIITAGTAPKVAAMPAAGTGATVLIDGNDTSGTITVTTGAMTTTTNADGQTVKTGTDPTIGDLGAVEFTKQFGRKVQVSLTPANASAADMRYFVQGDTTKFTLSSTSLPAQNQTYVFTYLVRE